MSCAPELQERLDTFLWDAHGAVPPAGIDLRLVSGLGGRRAVAGMSEHCKLRKQQAAVELAEQIAWRQNRLLHDALSTSVVVTRQLPGYAELLRRSIKEGINTESVKVGIPVMCDRCRQQCAFVIARHPIRLDVVQCSQDQDGSLRVVTNAEGGLVSHARCAHAEHPQRHEQSRGIAPTFSGHTNEP